jgi:protein TonB
MAERVGPLTTPAAAIAEAAPVAPSATPAATPTTGVRSPVVTAGLPVVPTNEVQGRDVQPTAPRARPPERTAAVAEPGAEHAERRGQDDGQASAAASHASARPSRETASTDGNAAASNYPGLVLRKLSRTRRTNVGHRGTAVVGFEVAASGGLVGARILRTSGIPEVDRAALDHLSRAAPFPPPPEGAERRFQVEYQSRG